jgi:hypothetical protein
MFQAAATRLFETQTRIRQLVVQVETASPTQLLTVAQEALAVLEGKPIPVRPTIQAETPPVIPATRRTIK